MGKCVERLRFERPSTFLEKSARYDTSQSSLPIACGTAHETLIALFSDACRNGVSWKLILHIVLAAPIAPDLPEAPRRSSRHHHSFGAKWTFFRQTSIAGASKCHPSTQSQFMGGRWPRLDMGCTPNMRRRTDERRDILFTVRVNRETKTPLATQREFICPPSVCRGHPRSPGS